LLEKNAQGKIAQVPVQPKGLALHIPMVVLVNGGTASAAEIVSGALQDAHRAVLVGETTFGTGTVLKEFPLSGGSALLLAVEEWLTPDGHTIWHRGITPNIVVSLPSQAIPIFPDALGGMTSAQLQASGDTQLLRAMNLLAKEER
jgi:carboxyl-terminal processing protease